MKKRQLNSAIRIVVFQIQQLRLYLFIVPFLFIAFSSLGQNKYVEEIVPPSPNGASLGKYGEFPVSLFSGTPDISIPIWELKAKDLSLPISLSYHASGVKVEQTSSWVGMGWALNAGGVISRTVRGATDRVNENGELKPSRDYLPIAWYPTKTEFDKMVDVTLGSHMDTEPDVFFYNFNGRTGSFFLDASGEAVITPYEDLRIEFTMLGTGPNNKFIITDEQGVQYHFEEIESSNVAGVMSAPTAWYLSKMINANETDYIEFIYQRENYSYHNPPRFSTFHRAGTNNTLIEVIPADLPNSLADRPCRSMTIGGARLEKIISPHYGSIEFVPSDEVRKDVRTTEAKALRRILIKDVNGIEKRNFRLDFSYVKTTQEYEDIESYRCPFLSITGDYMNYRLYLDRVVESSEKMYEFTYYGRTAEGDDMLPHRLSYAQDWSGYYNGQDNNESLVPTYTGLFLPDLTTDDCSSLGSPTYTYPSGQININGANREVSFPEVQYGTIAYVRYPTGGTSEFIFERHNSYIEGSEGGIRIQEIINHNSDGTILNSKKYTYSTILPGYGQDFYSYTYYSPQAKLVSFFPNCYIEDESSNPAGWAPTLKISSGPYNDLGAYNGNYMGYQYVTVTETGNGKIVHEFTDDLYSDSEEFVVKVLGYSTFWPGDGVDHESYSVTGNQWPFGPTRNNTWRRGTLLFKTFYDNSGKQVRREEYDYEFIELSTVPGIKIQTIQSDLLYVFSEYEFPVGWKRLDQKKVIQYDYEGGTKNEVISTEDYQYLGTTHKQLTKTTTTRSNGESVETSLLYTADQPTLPNTNATVINEMIDRHMIGQVVKSESKIGSGQTIYGQVVNFKQDNNLILRKSIENYYPGIGYNEQVFFNKYDERGNLLSLQGTEGIPVSILWGYDKTLPVAQVAGAEDSEVSNVLTVGEINDLQSMDGTALHTKLNELREELPSAQVTTFAHDPLVGMTSRRDFNNLSTYFEYDPIGRLSIIRDQEQNILKKYSYHYGLEVPAEPEEPEEPVPSLSMTFENDLGLPILGDNAITDMDCDQVDIQIIVKASGGTAPYTYIANLSSQPNDVIGSLKDWDGNSFTMRLNRNSPTAATSISIDITVTDATQNPVTQTVTFTVPWNQWSDVNCP